MQPVSEKILLNDFGRLWSAVGPDVLSAVSTVGESGWYILGEQVRGFEQNLATHWGLPYAVGVANGLDAIEIGLRILGLKPGDKVLTTPLSAFATTLAILRAGGVPVFVDVDESGQLDLVLAEAAIVSHGIRFLVPVHLFGQPLNLEELETLKNQYNLLIVEDCAQAIGASWAGRPVGSVGQVATTSFYPTKNLGAFGDGGALLSKDETLAKEAACFRDYGQTAKYVHARKGLNSRLDELQAAILNHAMLPRLSGWNAERQRVARQYMTGLTNPLITLPVFATSGESVWHLFPVLVKENRDGFMAYLKENHVASAIHYPGLIPEQPVMSDENYILEGTLHQAQRFAREEVSLPIHPYLTDAEVAYVVAICNAWEGS